MRQKCNRCPCFLTHSVYFVIYATLFHYRICEYDVGENRLEKLAPVPLATRNSTLTGHKIFTVPIVIVAGNISFFNCYPSLVYCRLVLYKQYICVCCWVVGGFSTVTCCQLNYDNTTLSESSNGC